MKRYTISSNIIIVVSFLVAIYLYATFFVLEDVQRLTQVEQKLEQLQKSLVELQEEIEKEGSKLQESRRFFPFVERMQHKLDLRKIVDPFFVEFQLRLIETKQQERIERQHYLLEGVITDTRDFFMLVQEIESKGYPIKITLPIEMRKKGKFIEVAFGVDLYRLQLKQDRSQERNSKGE